MKIDEELIIKLAFGVGILIMWGIVNEMSYQDDVLEQKQYIEEVCKEYTPNYKQWDIDCNTRSLR